LNVSPEHESGWHAAVPQESAQLVSRLVQAVRFEETEQYVHPVVGLPFAYQNMPM
jgi:hypothetical protein